MKKRFTFLTDAFLYFVGLCAFLFLFGVFLKALYSCIRFGWRLI
jgi:hypothetical protein